MQWSALKLVSTKDDAANHARYVDKFSSFRLLDDGAQAFASTRRLDLGNSFLVESVSTGYDMSADDGGMIAFTFPSNGTVTRAIGDRQITAAPGEFQLLLPSVRSTHIRAAGRPPFGALSYFAPMQLLHRHTGFVKKMNLAKQSRTLRAAHEIAVGTALASFILQVCKSLAGAHGIAQPDRTRALSENLLGELLADLMLRPGEEQSEPAASKNIVCRVEEKMRADHAEPIAIADLAQDEGVNIRSLQLAFKRHRGKSPMSTLTDFRLSQARAKLISAPDETVISIALACGIAHMGRFAMAYRKKYGETPSETLAKVRSL